MKLTSCPANETLTDYVLGKLPSSTLGVIAEHAASCVECQQRLQRMDGVSDPLIIYLRRPMLDNLAEADPALLRLLTTTETIADERQAHVIAMQSGQARRYRAASRSSSSRPCGILRCVERC